MDSDSIVFLPKTRPLEGESTVLRIPGDVVTLLQHGVAEMRELHAGGYYLPMALMRRGGAFDGHSLSLEGIRAAYSPEGMINYFVPRLRRALADDAAVAGVFCYASFDTGALVVTEKPDEHAKLIAWLEHWEGEAFEVLASIDPDGASGPTAERIPHLPIFTAFKILSIIHAPGDEVGPVTACTVAADLTVATLRYRNGVVIEWDLREQRELRRPQAADVDPALDSGGAAAEIPDGGDGPLRASAATPDGRYALASYDGIVELLDLEFRTQVYRLSMRGYVSALTFAPDTRYALLGHDNGDLTFIQLFPG